MAQTTFTSRDFNQHVSDAKKASLSGPVFVTDRGKPAYVLLSIDQFKELADKGENIVDMVAMPEVAELDLDTPKNTKPLFNVEAFD